jgi:hypothetical protein
LDVGLRNGLGSVELKLKLILRHEDVSTTQRFYIKTAPRVAQEAMRVLEEKIACTTVVSAGCGQLKAKSLK